jgi:hypothetical protein
MTDLRTAAQQALEALEYYEHRKLDWCYADEAAITALRAALEQPEQANLPEEKLQAVAEYVGDKYHVWYGIGARDVEEVLRQSARLGLVALNSDTVEQPEQEPVAWMCSDENLANKGYSRFSKDKYGAWNIAVFTHPPRREWRGLTDEEISALFPSHLRGDYKDLIPYSFARAIEAALKERNA